jgi:hypothetical protein
MLFDAVNINGDKAQFTNFGSAVHFAVDVKAGES